MLVLREAFYRTRRFEDFQRNLGVARNVLADRLAHLVQEGILSRERYSERPERFEYRLTPKGLDLYPLLAAAMVWGDKYTVERPPVVLTHMPCGHDAAPTLTCGHCGEQLDPREVRSSARPAPLTASA